MRFDSEWDGMGLMSGTNLFFNSLQVSLQKRGLIVAHNTRNNSCQLSKLITQTR